MTGWNESSFNWTFDVSDNGCAGINSTSVGVLDLNGSIINPFVENYPINSIVSYNLVSNHSYILYINVSDNAGNKAGASNLLVLGDIPSFINDTNQTNQTEICIDSDNGLDYFTSGNVSFNYFGEGPLTNFEDQCLIKYFSDGNVTYVSSCNNTSEYSCAVNEYFCAGSEMSVSSYTCQDGCQNGACIVQNQTNQTACIQNWYVGSWSTCNDGTQTRIVNDLNNCNNLTGMPVVTQDCNDNSDDDDDDNGGSSTCSLCNGNTITYQSAPTGQIMNTNYTSEVIILNKPKRCTFNWFWLIIIILIVLILLTLWAILKIR
jgi:hypothetical protein